MSLSVTTLRKLIREHLPDGPGLRPDPDALAATIDDLKARLLALPGVEDVTAYRGHHCGQKDTLLVLELREPGSETYYWRHTEVALCLDEALGLVLVASRERKPLADPEAVVGFIRACQAAQQRRRAKDVKRKKLRNLKAQAIIARIKTIAREDGFDFATRADSVKLKLYIRLGEREILELDIPFKGFEEILPRLRETIADIRKLQAEGIRFRLRQSSPYVEWVNHKDL